MDTTSAVTASGSSTYAARTAANARRSEDGAQTAERTQPRDSWTLSEEGAAAAADSKASAKSGWAGFDKAAFDAEMREKLLQQVRDAQKTLKEAGATFYGGSGFLYDIPEAEASSYTDEQMGVGQSWGADATSDRIVQFALAFRGSGNASGLSDEEFAEKIRDAIKEGFRLAKGDLGDLPGPTGKLFNDTYKASMDKLDKALEDMKGEGAKTKDAAPSTTSGGFSVLA